MSHGANYCGPQLDLNNQVFVFLIRFRNVRCSTNVQSCPRALNKVAQRHSVWLGLASCPRAACITRFARARISLIEYLRTTILAHLRATRRADATLLWLRLGTSYSDTACLVLPGQRLPALRAVNTF